MKTLFATFILIILSYTVIGQNNIEDVVYLKNGSIIRGLVLETIPNQTVKIQTVDRNIFVFLTAACLLKRLITGWRLPKPT